MIVVTTFDDDLYGRIDDDDSVSPSSRRRSLLLLSRRRRKRRVPMTFASSSAVVLLPALAVVVSALLFLPSIARAFASSPEMGGGGGDVVGGSRAAVFGVASVDGERRLGGSELGSSSVPASASVGPRDAVDDDEVSTVGTTTKECCGGGIAATAAGTEEEDGRNDDDDEKKDRSDAATLRTYVDPRTNSTLSALNLSEKKFVAWIGYRLGLDDIGDDGESGGDATKSAVATIDPARIATERISLDGEGIREGLRALWKDRRLIVDRTEPLAVYRSERRNEKDKDGSGKMGRETKKEEEERGGFKDLLGTYADRLVGIVRDEAEDDEDHRRKKVAGSGRADGTGTLVDAAARKKMDVLAWLSEHYGDAETADLQAASLLAKTDEEQIAAIRRFLEWFRTNFPYYRDKCGVCGASEEDDNVEPPPPLSPPTTAAETTREPTPPPSTVVESYGAGGGSLGDDDVVATDGGAGDLSHLVGGATEVEGVGGIAKTGQDDGVDDDDEDEGGTFLGYVYPFPSELLGKASRTELYRCHRCRSFTRFPRYNAAASVLLDRRGRCGEYSMLLFRMLRALGHDARWVVDWSDHVWAEALLGNGRGTDGENDDGGESEREDEGRRRWVHLDPCEAAVDEPLLYQGWGKRQTYIVAFRAPRRKERTRAPNSIFAVGAHSSVTVPTMSSPTMSSSDDAAIDATPLVEDVTMRYTRDDEAAVAERRKESSEEVKSCLQQAEEELQAALDDVLLGR